MWRMRSVGQTGGALMKRSEVDALYTELRDNTNPETNGTDHGAVQGNVAAGRFTFRDPFSKDHRVEVVLLRGQQR
jgi:hypothetical protein